MKKNYETAEIQVFLFDKPDVIVASGEGIIITTTDTDETEIL